MTLRAITAGLLVGVLGMAALAAAFAIEHYTVGQVRTFLTEHPELFPVSPNNAILGLLGLTIWLGLILAFIYGQAFPHSIPVVEAIRFGTLHWLGVAVPVIALALLWTPLPPAGVTALLGGWMVELIGGSVLLTRLLPPAPSASHGSHSA